MKRVPIEGSNWRVEIPVALSTFWFSGFDKSITKVSVGTCNFLVSHHFIYKQTSIPISSGSLLIIVCFEQNYTCPSFEALKNSVPVLELIHKVLSQGSLWLNSTELMSIISGPLLRSQQPTCPVIKPPIKVLLSLGLYSNVRIGQKGFSVM